jgi:hypothetical protein
VTLVVRVDWRNAGSNQWCKQRTTQGDLMVTNSIILLLCVFVAVGLVSYRRRASERGELCKVLHLPPDATDQQMKEAQDKSVKKFERLMLGLPHDASDEETAAASRSLQSEMLARRLHRG